MRVVGGVEDRVEDGVEGGEQVLGSGQITAPRQELLCTLLPHHPQLGRLIVNLVNCNHLQATYMKGVPIYQNT